MAGFADLSQSRPIEYFILWDAMPIGQRIGSYSNKASSGDQIEALREIGR